MSKTNILILSFCLLFASGLALEDSQFNFVSFGRTENFPEITNGIYRFCIHLGYGPATGDLDYELDFEVGTNEKFQLKFDSHPENVIEETNEKSQIHKLSLLKNRITSLAWNVQSNELLKSGTLSGWIISQTAPDFMTLSLRSHNKPTKFGDGAHLFFFARLIIFLKPL